MGDCWVPVWQRRYSVGRILPQLKEASYAQSFWVVLAPGSVGACRPRRWERWLLVCCGHPRTDGTRAAAKRNELKSMLEKVWKEIDWKEILPYGPSYLGMQSLYTA